MTIRWNPSLTGWNFEPLTHKIDHTQQLGQDSLQLVPYGVGPLPEGV